MSRCRLRRCSGNSPYSSPCFSRWRTATCTCAQVMGVCRVWSASLDQQRTRLARSPSECWVRWELETGGNPLLSDRLDILLLSRVLSKGWAKSKTLIRVRVSDSWSRSTESYDDGGRSPGPLTGALQNFEQPTSTPIVHREMRCIYDLVYS